jgi:hypothetical protein
MKGRGEVKVNFHAFLVWALDGDKSSASPFSQFTRRKRAFGARLKEGWVTSSLSRRGGNLQSYSLG